MAEHLAFSGLILVSGIGLFVCLVFFYANSFLLRTCEIRVGGHAFSGLDFSHPHLHYFYRWWGKGPAVPQSRGFLRVGIILGDCS